MSRITVSLDMLRKYDQPGPRYTSYPPATHFTENPGLVQGGPDPLSLYFHLPFCSTQCLYCGCTNIVTNNRARGAEYLEYIKREVAMRAAFVHGESQVVQLQLGGGTPTFFEPSELEELGQLVRSHFRIADEIEAGVEIDPRSLTQEKVQALRNAGFNRASLGVQDINPDVQKTIARIQPFELIDEANRWLRDSGMESINFDMIYGLPNQTVDSFSKSLDEVLTLSPDRFAIYSYAHIPWIKAFQKSFEHLLPGPETKLELLQLIIEKLTGAGYVYIGMDHFAKPEDGMAKALANGTLQRNFQGYSTCKGVALHGFGMSSISHANNIYYQNEKELDVYYAALNAGRPPIMRGYAMTDEDRIRYRTIMHIMCDLFVDYAALSAELQLDFAEHFKSEIASLDDLEADGLVQRSPDGLQVTPLGRLFIRIIAMRFDAYIGSEQRMGRYSRTV